ncbi:MAG: hypothetical protein KQH83_10950 [Actinobacteria bacterium]|nr:hypothetical protein [Actinomycetota bacterium]
MIEAIGWAASGLVILSLMATSVVRLRLIGLAAAGAFVAYGVLIGAWPIVITNAVAGAIHVWRLRGLLFVEEFFEVLPVQASSAYLAYFCEFHADDIRRFVPGFTYEPADGQVSVFVLRDMVPAGVFIAVPSGDRLQVRLDYVTPRYRDFKVGRFLYAPGSGVFDGVAATTLSAEGATPRHRAYLERMGYTRADGDRYTREVPRA